MVCEAKIKKVKKKKKNRKSKGVLLEKILIIYLKCNAVKELGIKKKKKFCFWVNTHYKKTTTAISADICVATE